MNRQELASLLDEALALTLNMENDSKAGKRKNGVADLPNINKGTDPKK